MGVVTAGTVMSVAAGGEITFPLQSAFSAYLGAQVTNVTGNGATWTLGTTTALTEIFDQNADFNTNGTFTAPVTGRYWLRGFVAVSGITVSMTPGSITIVTSNRSYQAGKVDPGASHTFQMGVFADMDAADTATVTIILSNGSGDTADADGGATPIVTYFGGFLSC
jgi:hypothetical protein